HKEALWPIIPNYVISPFHFFRQRYLRRNDCGRGIPIKSHAFHQALHLDLLRARHHHHPIAKLFSTCLVKKWNVGKKIFIRLAMLCRFAAPVLTNWRMKNFFELAPLLRRLENHRAKCASIQLPICIKNVIAKFLTNLGEDGLVMVCELARHGVGIEKLCLRQELTQAIYKSRFASGNSPGDPDRWHFRNIDILVCAPNRHSCRFPEWPRARAGNDEARMSKHE